MLIPNKLFFLSLTTFLLICNTISYSQLIGNYTIGTGGNYLSINSAVSALVNNGISGPVVFNIISGNYFESVIIDSVAGSNQINTVTFKSQSGSANDVTWYNTYQPSNAFTVMINGADNLIFNRITFSGDSSGNTSRRLGFNI